MIIPIARSSISFNFFYELLFRATNARIIVAGPSNLSEANVEKAMNKADD
jgi:hypothetical protein